MSFAVQEKKRSIEIEDKQTPHTTLQKLSLKKVSNQLSKIFSLHGQFPFYSLIRLWPFLYYSSILSYYDTRKAKTSMGAAYFLHPLPSHIRTIIAEVQSSATLPTVHGNWFFMRSIITPSYFSTSDLTPSSPGALPSFSSPPPSFSSFLEVLPLYFSHQYLKFIKKK